MPFAGRDWRSPGDKWIRTEFGWKRLSDIGITLNAQIVQQLRNLSSGSLSRSRSRSSSSKTSPRQLSRKTSPARDSEAVKKWPSSSSEAPCCSSFEAKERSARLGHLHQMLAQRCVSARTSSRESNQYATISDAINKLNFQQALYDENCFPFVCKVLLLLFEDYYYTLSGSLQTTLLRITETAKDIVMETRKHSGLILKMIDRAIATLEKGRKHQLMGFGIRSIDMKIKNLLRMKRQLQGLLLESTCLPYQEGGSTGVDLSCLPSDCLRQITSHLSHPKDVLNLGQTNMTLHSVTEENWVWRELTHYHYGQIEMTSHEELRQLRWKEVFKQEYRLSKGQLRGELSHAVSLCKICNVVFWRSYGHPCSETTDEVNDTDSQGLTAEQFLHLFVS